MTPEQQAKLAEIARRQRSLSGVALVGPSWRKCHWVIPTTNGTLLIAECHPQ